MTLSTYPMKQTKYKYQDQNMESVPRLPILLVSAKDQDAAIAIISEIIHKNTEESETSKGEPCGVDCIWKITNKYYTAEVRVHALLDNEDLEAELAESVEAHLIYLTQDECEEESVIATVQRRAAAGLEAHVRLVAAEARCESAALAAASARAGLELVALREPAPADHDPRDERGADRVRAALHAHLWTGLERQTPSGFRVPDLEDGSDSSSDEWSEWCEGPAASPGSEEAFLAALTTLPGAAAAARGTESREERLARAEQLVAAFCHALGTPFD